MNQPKCTESRNLEWDSTVCSGEVYLGSGIVFLETRGETEIDQLWLFIRVSGSKMSWLSLQIQNSARMNNLIVTSL